MKELIIDDNKRNVYYYNVFPFSVIENNNSKYVGGTTAAIVNLDKEDTNLEEMSKISSQLENTVVTFAQNGKEDTFDYVLNFFFNGIKVNLFSFAIVAFLRHLYDQSILRATISFNIDNVIIKGSSRPDKDMNFFIRYEKPDIIELEFSLYDVLNCLSLKTETLDSKHKVSLLEGPLIRNIPLPVKSLTYLEELKFNIGNIVNIRRKNQNFPSLYIYFLKEEKNTIRSRYFRTSSILMENKAYPIQASMLHYFLSKVDKKFNNCELIHYQGKNKDELARVITKIDDSENKITLFSGGNCIPID